LYNIKYAPREGFEMHEISQRIKYYRKKHGLTQTDVAGKLGIRTDNYAKYESGARTPRPDRLVKLSKILGVSYDALNEGVERGFADLLRSHAVNVIIGDSCSFSAFPFDMEASHETYPVVAGFFAMGEHRFAAGIPAFYEKYMAKPDMAALFALYEMYGEQSNPGAPEEIDGISLKLSYRPNLRLEAVTTLKWAFCIAVTRYLRSTDGASVMDEAEELAGSALEHINALQFFAVKVFVPYLSFIIDAVDLCMNTTIDDFEKAFLFCALTHPDEESELLMDGTEDDGDDDD
jgi:transcriptional regulator with XRE-family HTH domain